MTSFALRPALHFRQQRTRILRVYCRNLSRTHGKPESRGPVELSYSSIIPENGNETEKPLVILHGLFGSKRNWGSLTKAFHRDMPERPIYALDLRNHGASPHVTPMTYEAMADDVYKFVVDKNLRNVALLGHSMGGKAAMAFALSLKERNAPSNTLSHLIIEDITPSIGRLSPEFLEHISAMKEIESLPPGTIKTRTDADHYLKRHEPDVSVRQFLLTNLHIPSHLRTGHDASHERVKFIVPLDILASSMDDLGSFPYRYSAEDNSVPTTWDGPTLAIKGTKSPFINRKNLPALRAFFPNICLEEIDTGHWVHAEKPKEFKDLVVRFLQSS